MRSPVSHIAFLGGLLTALPVGAQTNYLVVDLGPEVAVAINNSTQILLNSALSGPTQGKSFLWESGRLSDLGYLELESTTVYDLNDHGQIVGESLRRAPIDRVATGLATHAIRSDGGHLVDLGTLNDGQDGYVGSDDSHALAINRSGLIVGWSTKYTDHGSEYRAFTTTGGPLQDLGVMGGASGVNDAGDIVGELWPPNADQPHAFLRIAGGGFTDLGPVGFDLTQSHQYPKINNAREIIVNVISADKSLRAYLHQAGSARDLGSLGGGRTEAWGINHQGQVVGGGTTGQGTASAFLFQNGSISDLNKYIRTPGWRLYIATDINDQGRIVGTGLSPRGDLASYLLIPTNSPPGLGQPPRILSHPPSQGGLLGTDITLTVLAEGSPPLSYQWFKDNAVVPGGTQPVLKISNLRTNDSGRYWAVVTNSYGRAVSSEAIVHWETLEFDGLYLTLTGPLLRRAIYTSRLGTVVKFEEPGHQSDRYHPFSLPSQAPPGAYFSPWTEPPFGEQHFPLVRLASHRVADPTDPARFRYQADGDLREEFTAEGIPRLLQSEGGWARTVLNPKRPVDAEIRTVSTAGAGLTVLAMAAQYTNRSPAAIASLISSNALDPKSGRIASWEMTFRELQRLSGRKDYRLVPAPVFLGTNVSVSIDQGAPPDSVGLFDRLEQVMRSQQAAAILQVPAMNSSNGSLPPRDPPVHYVICDAIERDQPGDGPVGQSLLPLMRFRILDPARRSFSPAPVPGAEIPLRYLDQHFDPFLRSVISPSPSVISVRYFLVPNSPAITRTEPDVEGSFEPTYLLYSAPEAGSVGFLLEGVELDERGLQTVRYSDTAEDLDHPEIPGGSGGTTFILSPPAGRYTAFASSVPSRETVDDYPFWIGLGDLSAAPVLRTANLLHPGSLTNPALILDVLGSDPWQFITIAGNAGYGSRDGLGTEARFSEPGSLAIDKSGTVYVADTANHVIRRVTSDGRTSTIAGLAGNAGFSDGQGFASRFSSPHGIAINQAGEVFIGDAGNGALRKIGTNGWVSTPLFLNNTYGGQYALAIGEPGDIYLCLPDHTILKHSPQRQETVLLAGKAGERGQQDGRGESARFWYPSAIVVDREGYAYVADRDNSTLRRISPDREVVTLAGTPGSAGSTDGSGASARFGTGLSSLSMTANGQILARDGHPFLRLITPAGTVSSLRIPSWLPQYPTAVAVGPTGEIHLLSDHALSVFQPSLAGYLRAGSVAGPGLINGSVSISRLNSPEDVTVDSQLNVYVADTGNSIIRRISPTGLTTLYAGEYLDRDQDGYGDGGYLDGSAQSARFSWPQGVCAGPQGEVYVADTGNYVVRKIAVDGKVTTLAGNPGISGWQDGPASAAEFRSPTRLAVGKSGIVYVADGFTIRAISPSGLVTTLAGNPLEPGTRDGVGAAATLGGVTAIAIAADQNLWITQEFENAVRKISPSGVVITLALSSPNPEEEGLVHTSPLRMPLGIAVDPAGTIFISDSENNVIRGFSSHDGFTMIAGRAATPGGLFSARPGSEDGAARAARFNRPAGIALDRFGNLYVADSMNHSVRRGALKGQGPLPVPSLRAEWSGSSLLRIYARLPSGGGQASLPRLRLQAAPSLAAVEALEWVDLPIEGSIENDSATFDVTAAFQDGWRFFRLIGP